MSTQGRRRTAGAALGLAIVLVSATPAAAAPTTEIVQGTHVRIASTADWSAMSRLSPGRPEPWMLTITADAPDPGEMSVSVRSTGSLALLVDAAACPVPWEAGSCPHGRIDLSRLSPVPSARTVLWNARPAQEPIHLLLNVSLAPSGAPDANAALTVTVEGRGIGTTQLGGPLARTGGSPLLWAVPAGLLAIVLGGAHVVAARRRAGRR